MSDPTERGDRPERPDRPDRNTARSNERAARNNDRAGGDRPARSNDDRPARSNDDRPARSSNDRPARSNDDRPARSNNDRPARPYSNDRPARSNDGRPPRSNDDRPARSYGGDRPDRPARSSSDRPDRPARSSDRQPGRPSNDRDRSDRPARTGDSKKLWTDRGAPARNNRDAGASNAAANAAAAAEWEDRDPFNTRSVRSRHDDPIIPEDVSPDELDRVARNELKTLAKDNAEGVAQHLAMAARLIESDPTLAHAHAVSAARRAGRIGVVRETLAITAYAIGDYALALRELRTHRRITGRDDQLPLMVDCERALGRPDKALELARSVPKSKLSVPVQVELAIAMSGARLDQGDAQAALQEVTIPQLDPTHVFSYSADLFAAYATCLEDLGRDEDAELWWAHADTAQEAVDERDLGVDGETIDIYEDDLEADFDDDLVIESGDVAELTDDETDVSDETNSDETSTDENTEADAPSEVAGPVETTEPATEESTTDER